MSKKISQTEQTEETSEETKTTKPESITFELSDGTQVVLKRGTAIQLAKARHMANKSKRPETTNYYIFSMLATFDGEKRCFDDLMELPMDEALYLEDKWNEFMEVKNSQAQETL